MRVAKASERKTIENATQAQTGRDTRLARIIPAMNASENHISGRCVINCSGIRLVVGGFAACMMPRIIA